MDHRNFFYKLLYERNTFGSQPISIYNSAKNNRYLLQRLTFEKSLDVHNGCVNTICWNSTGQYLLSGSDDLHLCITDAFTNEVKASIRTGHATNIFSAKYLPNTSDSQVISCSGDGIIIYSDLNRPETSTKNIFDCQDESVYDIATVPNDSHSFLTCSHDRTVRWYDLRVKSSCVKHPAYSRFARRYTKKCDDDVLIRCDYPVTAIAVNTLMPWQLAIGCSDSIIRIYDRRMLSTKSLSGGQNLCDQNSSVLAKFTYDGVKSSNRITSLAYSRNCNQILASYSNDHLYLFDINDVHSTISNSLGADIIPDKSDNQPSCSFKRFRLRGDWSDTGPNALTTDELRVANTPRSAGASSAAAAAGASSFSAGGDASARAPSNDSINASNSASSSIAAGAAASGSGDASAPTAGGNNEARIRYLNTILSLILRNSLRESNESLHSSENNNLSSDEAIASAAAATTTTTTTTSTGVAASSTTTFSSSAQSSSAAGGSGQSANLTTYSTIRSNDSAIDSAANDPRLPPANARSDDDGSSQARISGGRRNSSDPTRPAAAATTSSNSGDRRVRDGDNHSPSSSNNHSFYIHIFDNDDYPTLNRRFGGGGGGGGDDDDDDDDDGDEDANQEDAMLEDDDDDPDDIVDDDDEGEIDSDTTNDSVFNHFHESTSGGGSRVRPYYRSSRYHHSRQSPLDDHHHHNSNSDNNNSRHQRQRSRSSSSNDSSRRVRRRTRSNRSNSSFQRHHPHPQHQQRKPTPQQQQQHQQQRQQSDSMYAEEKQKRLKTYRIRNFKTFVGHRNSRTVIKEATFWGDDYIVSGSDCGHIFFWSIEDCQLAMILQGDHHVVNCLQPHPTDPILASSGIDYDIKIWSPRSEDCQFDRTKAKKIMDRNKQMLEDTRDTVTVPTRFVLSLFSTLRNRQQDRSNQAADNAPRNDDSWLNHDANMDDDDEVEL